jgi:hypothetical protein
MDSGTCCVARGGGPGPNQGEVQWFVVRFCAPIWGVNGPPVHVA